MYSTTQNEMKSWQHQELIAVLTRIAKSLEEIEKCLKKMK